MKTIQNQTFDAERALYGSKNILVRECSFDGPADGESAFKECENVQVEDSLSRGYVCWLYRCRDALHFPQNPVVWRHLLIIRRTFRRAVKANRMQNMSLHPVYKAKNWTPHP